MPSADVQILGTGSKAAPLDYNLPSGSELLLKAVRADFDGSGAAGDFLPAVEIISDAGHSVGVYPTDVTVAAGGSASVSFAPFLRNTGAGAPWIPPEVYQLRGVNGSGMHVKATDSILLADAVGSPVIFSYSQDTSPIGAFTTNQYPTSQFADVTLNFPFLYMFSFQVLWPVIAGPRSISVSLGGGSGLIEDSTWTYPNTTDRFMWISGVFRNYQVTTPVFTLYQNSGAAVNMESDMQSQFLCEYNL